MAREISLIPISLPSDTTARSRWSWPTLLAIAIWLVSVLLAVLAPILHQINLASPRTLSFAPNQALIAVTFPTVGVVIAAWRPRHPIGWIFCVAGLLDAIAIFGAQYAVFALFVNPDVLPAGDIAIWLTQWIWSPGFILSTTFLLLLFPTGTLVSPRWRWVAWLGAGATVLWVIPVAVFMWPLRGPLLVTLNDRSNSQPIPGLPALNLYADGAFLLMTTSIIPAFISLIARYRRAGEIERQQLKWFAFGSTVICYALIASWLDNFTANNLLHAAGWFLDLIAIPCLAIATGIAILRRHLYDIDIIINRTIVYGLLSGIMALIYFSSVVVLQFLFRAFTHQGETIAVVISTLAIAALFNPLRAAIQVNIDRRFYRRRYDLQKTVARFSAALLDEVDLGEITEQLLAVVDETMQPANMSLWLRAPHPLSSTDAAATTPSDHASH